MGLKLSCAGLAAGVLIGAGTEPVARAAPVAGDLFAAGDDGIYNIKDGGDFSGVQPYAWGLQQPEDACIGPGGRLYVTDLYSGVYDVTDGGDFTETQPFAFGIAAPLVLFCDGTQILVTSVAEGAGAVYDVTAGGDYSSMAPFVTGLEKPAGLFRDGNGRLWVSEFFPDPAPVRIFDVSAGGDFSGAQPFATSSEWLAGMAQWAGHLLVASASGDRLIVFDDGGDLDTAPSFMDGSADQMMEVLDAGSLGLLIKVEGGRIYDVSAGGQITPFTQPPFAEVDGDYGGMAYVTKGENCGDGIVDPGEACDDGGESAACDANCSAAECGDGVVNVTRGEVCDFAGESSQCDADCTTRQCGDGTANATAGETCDDGNMIDGDGCSSLCQGEAASSGAGAGGDPGKDTGAGGSSDQPDVEAESSCSLQAPWRGRGTMSFIPLCVVAMMSCSRRASRRPAHVVGIAMVAALLVLLSPAARAQSPAAEAPQDPCRQEAFCALRGKCTQISDGVCAATQDADCDASDVCRQFGECTAREGACRATDDAHCLASVACRSHGQCAASNGRCRKPREAKATTNDTPDWVGAYVLLGGALFAHTTSERFDALPIGGGFDLRIGYRFVSLLAIEAVGQGWVQIPVCIVKSPRFTPLA